MFVKRYTLFSIISSLQRYRKFSPNFSVMTRLYNSEVPHTLVYDDFIVSSLMTSDDLGLEPYIAVMTGVVTSARFNCA